MVEILDGIGIVLCSSSLFVAIPRKIEKAIFQQWYFKLPRLVINSSITISSLLIIYGIFTKNLLDTIILAFIISCFCRLILHLFAKIEYKYKFRKNEIKAKLIALKAIRGLSNEHSSIRNTNGNFTGT